MSLKKVSLFLLLLFTLQACNDDDDSDAGGKPVACTEQFESILLQVVNGEGELAVLDSIQVFRGEEEVTMHSVTAQPSAVGYYLIIDDSKQAEYYKKEVDLQIYGYLNEKKVVDKTVKMSADECHVFSLTEDLKVVID